MTASNNFLAASNVLTSIKIYTRALKSDRLKLESGLLQKILLKPLLMFFIAYTFNGQVHVFAGRVRIVGHSSCGKSTILEYFCPLLQGSYRLDKTKFPDISLTFH